MADQVIQTIVDWISVVPPAGIYLIFLAICYLENLIPPVPGDVLLAFGGYLAAEGLVSLPLLWIISVIASVVGFMNMYWLGHKFGGHIDEHKDAHFLMKFVNYRYFRKGKIWMYTYGQWVVLANRFLAGTRSVIALTAGGSSLNVGFTVMNSFISSALWNTILLGSGWFVKDNWQIIGRYLSAYGKVILIGICILILGRILWVKVFRKAESAEELKK